MMNIQKKDFIEIEFVGRVKDGEVFDSNIPEEVKKLSKNIDAKPFRYSVGEGMFLKGIDDFLIGKEIGKEYQIELSPENAFGKRNPNLIYLIPAKAFREQNLNPIPGAVFNFDGRVAKVLSVSGGRVRVDFNNPLAGREVVYTVRVLRKIYDIKEKVDSLNEFFFKKKINFKIDGKKIILMPEEGIKKFVELFKDKLREILGQEIEIKNTEDKENARSEVDSKKSQ